jgi:signal transduction histidine kinase
MSFVSRSPFIRSLRMRLTALHLAALSLTVGLCAALAYLVLSETLYGHHDEELALQATELAQALGDRPLNEEVIHEAFVSAAIASRFVIIRDSGGGLIYRDPVLSATEPTLGENQMLIHAAASGAREPRFFNLFLERSGDVRFICAPLADGSAYVQLGEPLGEAKTVLHAVVWACLPLIPIVLFLATFNGWFIARRALAPVTDISDTLQRIHASDLAQRVDVTTRDAELAGLVTTINHLLDRLQRAFESLRQFAGDVSHQIQTPLTVMKGTVTAALRRPDHSAEDRQLLKSLVEEVDDISAVVVELRSFALADADIQSSTSVDLSQLIAEVSDVIAALGELRSVSVRSDVASGVVVRGDALRLKQAVLNLGDNAIKYSLPGGRVAFRLSATDGRAVLEVVDTGVGIAPQHLPRVFDRLFRADAADRSPSGTGLGLAIARRIVEAHGGSIHAKSRLGHGSTFTVVLPLY